MKNRYEYITRVSDPRYEKAIETETIALVKHFTNCGVWPAIALQACINVALTSVTSLERCSPEEANKKLAKYFGQDVLHSPGYPKAIGNADE